MPDTPKTIGDYGVLVEKATLNGSCADVEKVVVEMRSVIPPADPAAPPPPPPPPVNQGLRAYADQLEQCVATNNVFKAHQLAEEMKTVDPPTPAPVTPPASSTPTA